MPVDRTEAASDDRLGALLEELVHLARRVAPDAIVVGRVKSSASSREKAGRLGTTPSSLLDALGIRIIVRTLDQCHRVVDLLHLEYRRVFGEYDDYVRAPKANGYSALHTTLLTRGGHPFEVQVRTRAMHACAEGGLADHDAYKRAQAAPESPPVPERKPSMFAMKHIGSKSPPSRLRRGIDALSNVLLGRIGGAEAPEEGTPESQALPSEPPPVSAVVRRVGAVARGANVGARIAEEVAARSSEPGDAATTKVLAESMFDEGSKLIASGVDPREMKAGIDAAVDVVVAAIRCASTPLAEASDVLRVATDAAGGDGDVGAFLSEAIAAVGHDGVVLVEEGDASETRVVLTQGMQLECGFLSPYFATDQDRHQAILDDPAVLVAGRSISAIHDLLPLLEELSAARRPLLILASDVEGEALAALVLNRLRGTVQVCAVKSPGFGSRREGLLDDVAVLCGTRTVGESAAIEIRKVTLERLGRAKRVTIGKETTTIVEGGGTPEAIHGRLRQLRAAAEGTESEYDREKLQERIAKLAGGVAVVRVGAPTPLERTARKTRFDRALSAIQAAIAEGIVPGRGIALLRALPALEALRLPGDQRFGIEVVRRALGVPRLQLAGSGGVEPLESVQPTAPAGWGGEAFVREFVDVGGEEPVEVGPVDPAMVVRVSLEGAASVASLFLRGQAPLADLETNRASKRKRRDRRWQGGEAEGV